MTVLAASRLQQELKEAIESQLIAGANVLGSLADVALDCFFPDNDSRDAVAYGLFCFLERMAEAHQNVPTFTTTYANLFVSAASPVLVRASDFLVEGGSSDDAVRIVAELRRADNKLGKAFPGH